MVLHADRVVKAHHDGRRAALPRAVGSRANWRGPANIQVSKHDQTTLPAIRALPFMNSALEGVGDPKKAEEVRELSKEVV